MKFTFKHLRWAWIVGALCSGTASVAHAEPWPIVFTDIPSASAPQEGPEVRDISWDNQPRLFDPQKAKYHPRESDDDFAYELEGPEADECVSMEILHGAIRDGMKVQLPAPYSLVRYGFSCASTFSQVFEIRKSGVRHALYTHIEAAMFSPDLKKMVLFNYRIEPNGRWRARRRIIDIETKRVVALPVMNETSYIADMTNHRVVTYSQPAVSAGHVRERRRTVAIWGDDGKLIRALTAPIQTTAANAESSDDGIGLLPNEPSTFYHLTRTGKDECTLRLQDLQTQDHHRSIQLNVPGLATDPVAVGMLVQVELDELRLNGGGVKYRVAASGRGDVVRDWGPWQTSK